MFLSAYLDIDPGVTTPEETPVTMASQDPSRCTRHHPSDLTVGLGGTPLSVRGLENVVTSGLGW